MVHLDPVPELVVVRHAQSAWNATGRWQGWADPPLSAHGEAQAEAAAERLRGAGLVGVVVSDLERARRTGEVVAAALGLGAAVVEPGLRERDVGEWSGLTTTEIETRWPGMVEAWRTRAVSSPPGGEDDATFLARTRAALERVGARAGGPTLVVSHGGVLRRLVLDLAGTVAPVPNLCGRRFGYDGALTVGEVVVLADPDVRPVAPGPIPGRAAR